ncbi:MAG: hypothetical protein ACK5LX_10190 [Oscillospiraceae bacterium]
MYTTKKLDNAFSSAISIVNFKGGFDTFKFRKGFEYDLSMDEQEEVLDYLKTKIQKGSLIYQAVKSQIDNQEFLSSDYYANPYPRTFRGAYSPVVVKTFGGVMALSL